VGGHGWGRGRLGAASASRAPPITRMKRIGKRKLAALATIAVVLGGGTLAAVSAGGERSSGPLKHARVRGHVITARDLATAAAYLGMPQVRLAADLQAGNSLAAVASATRGKSAAGLIAALIARKHKRLAKQLSTLQERVAAEVNRSGGGPVALGARRRAGAGEAVAHEGGAPQRGGLQGGGLRGPFAGPNRLALIAADYLGMSPKRLQKKLAPGETLAQLADATRGKSAQGLIAALVAAKSERLHAALAAHRISEEQANLLSAHLIQRVSTFVNRRLGLR
jgi:hypothetical protein